MKGVKSEGVLSPAPVLQYACRCSIVAGLPLLLGNAWVTAKTNSSLPAIHTSSFTSTSGPGTNPFTDQLEMNSHCQTGVEVFLIESCRWVQTRYKSMYITVQGTTLCTKSNLTTNTTLEYPFCKKSLHIKNKNSNV